MSHLCVWNQPSNDRSFVDDDDVAIRVFFVVYLPVDAFVLIVVDGVEFAGEVTYSSGDVNADACRF